MRILVFTPYFPPSVGGLETLTAELVVALARRGHDVCVVTSSEPGNLAEVDDWFGVAVRRLPFHMALARNDVRRVAEVRRELAQIKRAFEPDVVHAHLADAAIVYHVLTEQDHAAPCVLTVHSSIAASEARPSTVLHRALVGADAVTACSRSMLDQVLAVVPEIAPRARVVLNGIQPDRVSPTPAPDDGPRVLLLGRLVRDKGFDVGLRAAAVLLDEFPDLRVLLVGDGPERESLHRLAGDLALLAHVDAPGSRPIDEVAAVYAEANVVVVPSRYPEPFGIVAVEAGLAARPVVASAVGGLPEIVLDGVNGLLVPPDDPGALAAAIGRVLRNRPLAVDLATAGRARMLEHFTMARHADELDALFRELVGS